MRAVLGLCVGDGIVHGVVVGGGRVVWAGSAPWTHVDGTGAALNDVVAQLAVEGARRVRTARVVLGRDLVQLRTLDPAPPIPPARAADYVRLEATRLFRRNGSPLVTDARMVRTSEGRALRAAAVSEHVLRAVLSGCAEAGLRVISLGPASDVIAAGTEGTSTGTIVFPNGTTSEHLEIAGGRVLRSRRVLGVAPSTVAWAPALATLGESAAAFAPAYAAALARPDLELWPDAERANRSRGNRRRLTALWVAALVCWGAAAGVHVLRLASSVRAGERELGALRGSLDSVLTVRRELNKARQAVATLSNAATRRSRDLPLLDQITKAFDDSTTIVALRVGDTAVSLAGYAPLAARARAQLERVGGLERVRFDGPVVRESVGDNATRRDLDRFALWAHRRSIP